MQTIKKRWQWLLGVGVLSLALAACGGVRADEGQREDRRTAPSSPTQQNEGVLAGGTTISVVADHLAFSLDAVEASAGTVTFAVTNDDSMPHDFAIEGHGVSQKTAILPPGQSAMLTLELRPGTYTYLCTIPGHVQLGMKGTFTVK